MILFCLFIGFYWLRRYYRVRGTFPICKANDHRQRRCSNLAKIKEKSALEIGIFDEWNDLGRFKQRVVENARMIPFLRCSCNINMVPTHRNRRNFPFYVGLRSQEAEQNEVFKLIGPHWKITMIYFTVHKIPAVKNVTLKDDSRLCHTVS